MIADPTTLPSARGTSPVRVGRERLTHRLNASRWTGAVEGGYAPGPRAATARINRGVSLCAIAVMRVPLPRSANV